MSSASHQDEDEGMSDARSNHKNQNTSEIMRNYQPDYVIEEEYSLNGVPVQHEDGSPAGDVQHIIEFETALMALEPMPKMTQPCPKKTLNFGVTLTKKNFDYLRPNQIAAQ